MRALHLRSWSAKYGVLRCISHYSAMPIPGVALGQIRLCGLKAGFDETTDAITLVSLAQPRVEGLIQMTTAQAAAMPIQQGGSFSK